MNSPSVRPTPQSDFDHQGAEFSADPATVYRRLFNQGLDVSWTPAQGGFWFLGSSEAVGQAARDDETFSSRYDTDGTGPVFLVDGEERRLGGIGIPPNPQRAGMIEMDPPEFTAYRRALNPLFAPARVAELRARVLEITTERLDAIGGMGECDLIETVTGPVPATLTMECLGLPLDRIEKYAHVFHDFISASPTSPLLPAIHQRLAEMMVDFASVVAERRLQPGDDWISYLLTAEVGGKPIPDDLVLENVFLILGGGVDTTTQLTSHGIMWLAAHPEQRDALRENPDRLGPACEEFLRYFSPVQMFARTVTKDVDVCGHALRPGERVMLGWASANRDPTAFENPDEVVLDRSPNRHLAFGVGFHRCIGSHLARMMFEVIVGEFIRRVPDYSVDVDRVKFYESRQVNGIVSLPIRYTPA